MKLVDATESDPIFHAQPYCCTSMMLNESMCRQGRQKGPRVRANTNAPRLFDDICLKLPKAVCVESVGAHAHMRLPQIIPSKIEEHQMAPVLRPAFQNLRA